MRAHRLSPAHGLQLCEIPSKYDTWLKLAFKALQELGLSMATEFKISEDRLLLRLQADCNIELEMKEVGTRDRPWHDYFDKLERLVKAVACPHWIVSPLSIHHMVQYQRWILPLLTRAEEKVNDGKTTYVENSNLRRCMSSSN